jgi:hypothetical protein
MTTRGLVAAVVVVVMAAALTAVGTASASVTAGQDFNALTGSDIHPWTNLEGQDGWRTRGYGGSHFPGVSRTLGFDGSPDVRFGSSGPGVGVDASRLRNASFPLPTFHGTETGIVLQADVRIGAWANQFALAYDADSSGTVFRDETTEIGPGWNVGIVPGVEVTGPAGSASAGLGAIAAVAGDWVRLRLVIDVTAGGGQGAASLFSQNLTAGATGLTASPAFQDVPLGLDHGATDARNPALWSGVRLHFEGSDNALDNVVVGVDDAAPVVAFHGNVGTYSVLDNVALTCTATDDLTGVAADPCAGFAINAPAWRFGAGATTVPAPGLVATDHAGNTSPPASTPVNVRVTSRDLCALNTRFVQASSQYQSSRRAIQRVVDLAVTVSCRVLTGPTNHRLTVALRRAYVTSLQVQQHGGWLSAGQVAVLSGLSRAL